MNYNDAFAINGISFKNVDSDKVGSQYQLNNYDYYEPKLVHDFYLKYFIFKLLFDTEMLELKDFLEYHFDYCENPEKYYSILDLIISPKIEEIIEHAQSNFQGKEYYNEKELEDGFVESEGVIKNWELDYPYMLYRTSLDRLQNSFKKRLQIIKGFVEEYEEKSQAKPLRWIAGPSQLAIIFRELIDKGYMEAEISRGDINNSHLSRNLFKTFSIDDCNSPKSIEIYLSPGNKRYKAAKAKFEDLGLFIPDAKFT